MNSQKKTQNNKAVSASEEQTFHLMFEGHSAVMLLVEPQLGIILDVNQAAVDFYGYSKLELCGMAVSKINTSPPEYIAAELQKALNEERNYFIFPHKLASGEERIVEVYSSPIALQKKQLLFSIVHDITDRKSVEEKLLLQSTALESAANAVAITDRGGVFQWVNPAWVAMTGYSKAESIGQTGRMIKSGKHDDAFYKNMWDTILAGKVWRGELVNKRKDGSLYYEEETITPVLDEQGNVKNFIAIKLDVTERKHAEAELRRAKESLEVVNMELRFAFEHEQHMARTDSLTRLNNRRNLFDLTEHEFEVAVRYRQPLSIIVFDIDYFKQINDTYGHAVGDKMLERVAQAARSELRDVDIIGRYGGEEFVIVLPVTTAQKALTLAQRILESVSAIRLHTDRGQAMVTLSIGIAEIMHTPDESVDHLMRRADEAMFAAKQNGRNRVVIFTQI